MPVDYRYGYGIVKYNITIIEYIQIMVAYIKRDLYGGCLANYMTQELEELLCGFDSKRHTIIRNGKYNYKIPKN